MLQEMESHEDTGKGNYSVTQLLKCLVHAHGGYVRTYVVLYSICWSPGKNTRLSEPINCCLSSSDILA